MWGNYFSSQITGNYLILFYMKWSTFIKQKSKEVNEIIDQYKYSGATESLTEEMIRRSEELVIIKIKKKLRIDIQH